MLEEGWTIVEGGLEDVGGRLDNGRRRVGQWLEEGLRMVGG